MALIWAPHRNRGNTDFKMGHCRINEVVFRGPINASGYGQVSFSIISQLRQLGYRVSIRPTTLSGRFRPIDDNIRNNLDNCESPNPWELLLATPRFCAATRKRIAYFTMWESSGLRPIQVSCLNSAECVLVPCRWNATCFRASGVQRPIEVVPLGIDVQVFKYSPMNLAGPCIFGTGGHLYAGGVRKQLNHVIDWFQKAFPTEKEVQLRVKAFPDCGIHNVNDTRVKITREYLSVPDLVEWYSELTCFASASRGEGWGLMQHEALAVGRPIISVQFGGVTEFFSKEVGYPIDYDLIPADGPYKGCGLWANPNAEHVITLLRRVYENRIEAPRLGINGARVAREFSLQKFIQNLLNCLIRIGMLSE